MGEDESQTERACVPEESAETARLSGQDKGIYARLAELLRDSEHEEPNRQPEPMAVPPHKDVHMEALEEVKDENTEPARVGSPRGNGLQGRKLPQGLLVDEQHGSGEDGFDKRKTDTRWLL